MKQKISKYIGIDVGGTKILIQSFDARLRLIGEKKVLTDTKHGHAGFLKQIYSLIDEFFEKSVKGIGIAVPGIVDYRKGVLVKAPHLPVGKGLPLKSLIEKKYGVRTYVDHDINGFLAEEYTNPRLKKHKNVLAVMVGTGLGGAAIIDGKMVYGEKGFAGEFGHMVIDEEGALKTLEENTSGHFLPKIAKHLGIPNALKFKAPYFWKKLEEGDKNAQKILKHITTNLGFGLSNLNLIFNPDIIVLGGSIYLKYLSKNKKELKKIIQKHSLAKQAPTLADAGSKSSVAKGIVMLLLKKPASA